MRAISVASLTALSLVTALLLTACDSNPSTQATAIPPISSKLNEIYDTFEKNKAARQRQHDEIVSTCMKNQGFEYFVVDFPVSKPTSSSAPKSLEFAQEYGYGITTNEGLSVNSDPSEEESLSNPNYDYLLSMSGAQSDAYLHALWGDSYGDTNGPTIGDTDVPSDGETSSYNWSTGGCDGQANHDVPTEFHTIDTYITADLDELSVKASNDKRVSQARAEWETCMADLGYAYKDTAESQAFFSAQVASRFDDENNFDDTGFIELQDKEVATAVDDFSCTQSSGLEATENRVLAELEEEYYASHKAEVDTWLEDLAALNN